MLLNLFLPQQASHTWLLSQLIISSFSHPICSRWKRAWFYIYNRGFQWPHLWQLVSEASWQDSPHTSSTDRLDALKAFSASGESQCSVINEKRPALSTGCWCLEYRGKIGKGLSCLKVRAYTEVLHRGDVQSAEKDAVPLLAGVGERWTTAAVFEQ